LSANERTTALQQLSRSPPSPACEFDVGS